MTIYSPNTGGAGRERLHEAVMFQPLDADVSLANENGSASA